MIQKCRVQYQVICSYIDLTDLLEFGSKYAYKIKWFSLNTHVSDESHASLGD